MYINQDGALSSLKYKLLEYVDPFPFFSGTI